MRFVHALQLRRARSFAGVPAAGFTLVELLMAFGLGMSLCALTLQAVLAEGQNSQRLARVLRERVVAQRALDLLRGDLLRATSAATQLPEGAAAACNLAGRAVLLHLETPQGPVTYSLGKPSEAIWRGHVLMRCGGAFGLDGTPSSGQALNRVVIDGLSSGGATATPQGSGAVVVLLRQQLPLPPSSTNQVLIHQRLLPWRSTEWSCSANLGIGLGCEDRLT